MTKEKGKKEGKHALWFEPEHMDNLIRMEEDIHKIMSDVWKRPIDFKTGMMPGHIRTILVDLSETDGDLIARIDLPGFSKEEIKLKVTENSIEISAEKKKQAVQKGKTFFRQERAFGAIKRVMPLPYAVKPDETKAKFENGVLAITMPKAEKKKVKEIKPE